MSDMTYYPLLVNLKGKSCVIVGGGGVAERKAGSLIEAGASVTVISPVCSSQLEHWMKQGVLSILYQSYRQGMPQIAQSLLVFAATNQFEINERVRLEAESMGKLVTVADQPSGSSFIVPAAVRRGKLLIAVSTGGASPAMARRIKQELEQLYGIEYEAYLDVMQELRLWIQCQVHDTSVRQQMFRVALDWELMSLIRATGRDETWKQELFERIAGEPSIDGMERIGYWIQQLIE